MIIVVFWIESDKIGCILNKNLKLGNQLIYTIFMFVLFNAFISGSTDPI